MLLPRGTSDFQMVLIIMLDNFTTKFGHFHTAFEHAREDALFVVISAMTQKLNWFLKDGIAFFTLPIGNAHVVSIDVVL